MVPQDFKTECDNPAYLEIPCGSLRKAEIKDLKCDYQEYELHSVIENNLNDVKPTGLRSITMKAFIETRGSIKDHVNLFQRIHFSSLKH